MRPSRTKPRPTYTLLQKPQTHTRSVSQQSLWTGIWEAAPNSWSLYNRTKTPSYSHNAWTKGTKLLLANSGPGGNGSVMKRSVLMLSRLHTVVSPK